MANIIMDNYFKREANNIYEKRRKAGKEPILVLNDQSAYGYGIVDTTSVLIGASDGGAVVGQDGFSVGYIRHTGGPRIDLTITLRKNIYGWVGSVSLYAGDTFDFSQFNGLVYIMAINGATASTFDLVLA